MTDITKLLALFVTTSIDNKQSLVFLLSPLSEKRKTRKMTTHVTRTKILIRASRPKGPNDDDNWNADHHGRLEVVQVWMVNGVKDMKSTPVIFNRRVPTLPLTSQTGVAQGIHVGDAG